mmetsp:Transcript_4179/g.7341  ORF Transcript_4179/g.7341 Transcript_4179/m.7341 type:complete len:272 (-) Transcript_4179:522-1337(-)
MESIEEGKKSGEQEGSDSDVKENEVLVYAKFVGNNWVHYMTDYCVTFGRAAKKSTESADIQFSGENSITISKIHARIRYSAFERAFELEALGKNPVYVDGVEYRKGDRPVKLRSNNEICLGKYHVDQEGKKSGTFFTFLLPSASVMAQPSKKEPKARICVESKKTLEEIVATTISLTFAARASIDEICLYINQKYPSAVKQFANDDLQILQNCVRHVLFLSDYFVVASGTEDKYHNEPAKWKIASEHRHRFLKDSQPTGSSENVAKRARLS